MFDIIQTIMNVIWGIMIIGGGGVMLIAFVNVADYIVRKLFF